MRPPDRANHAREVTSIVVAACRANRLTNATSALTIADVTTTLRTLSMVAPINTEKNSLTAEDFTLYVVNVQPAGS